MELKRVLGPLFSNNGEVLRRKDMPSVTLAKLRLASHPEAKPQSLMKLSQHGCENIVARVAENSNTEIEVLMKLAAHEHPDVRIALTENPNTPASVLSLLAADENVDVRHSLAENHNVPISVLGLLCDDENPYVADRANKTIKRLRQSSFRATGWFPFLRKRQEEIG